MPSRIPRLSEEAERGFWSRVTITGFCWEWEGIRIERGYGRIGIQRGYYLVHRVSYELLVGQIPEGMYLDHICRNRACVNPDHLQPVTAQENMRRGYSPSAVTLKTGICHRGHSMSDAYVTTRANGRVVRRCRACILAKYVPKDIAIHQKSCIFCGTSFTTKQGSRLYCGRPCAQRAYMKRKLENG